MGKLKVGSFLGILLLLNGCYDIADEESLEKEIPVPIRFSINEGSISTRAPVATIDASNVASMGIYGVQAGSTSGQFPWTTTPYVSNIAPSGISQGQLSFSPVLYYPMRGKQVKFYAYYPRTTSTTTTDKSYITPPGNGTAPVYNFTLSDQQDIMYAICTPSNSYNATPIAFQYNHKLCQIIINTGLLSGALQSMKILAVPTQGAMNLETGNITWGSTTADVNISIPLLGGPSTPVLLPANVSSYKLQATLLLLPLVTYTLTPSGGGMFMPGTVYTINKFN